MASSEIEAKFDRERSDLGVKFAGALQKLEISLQEKGELEDLLVVRKERELFTKAGTLGTEGSPELIRIRTLYTESRVPIDTREKEEVIRLKEAYLKQLETLQTDLTRSGEIETAVMVKNDAERIRLNLTGEGGPNTGPAPASEMVLAMLEPVPAMQHAPVGADIFKLDKWPLKIAIPQARYRIEGTRAIEGEKGREIQLLPGSVFRGADEQARWMIGNSTLVASEVEFDGFTFHGDLGSRLFFSKCQFKDMNVGKGGGWFGGRFMTRWQFRECRIEGSFSDRWNSKHFGVQMVDCHVERVVFPSIEYEKGDEPSEVAGQNWAMVRNTHFRKCVIPVSVLSLLHDCSFEECRFIDDPTPLTFATKVTRTVYLADCQWNVKALPSGFVVEQKPISEKP